MTHDLAIHLDTTVQEPVSGQDSSLLARIGGRRALDLVVDALYRGVLADPLLAPAFSGIDTDRVKAHQRRFLALVFGGSGHDPELLRRVHAPVAQRHELQDRHFDAVVAHLDDALRRCGVTPALVREVMAIAESTRDEVLGR